MGTRKKSKPLERGFVLFDVVYEDGSRASNRRIPIEAMNNLYSDDPARTAIEEQDAAIAERAGRPPLKIKQLTRAKS